LPIEIEHADEAVAKPAHRVGFGGLAGARRRIDRGNFDIAEIGRVAGAIARFGNVERQRRQVTRRAPQWLLGGRFGHIHRPFEARINAPLYFNRATYYYLLYGNAMEGTQTATGAAIWACG